MFSGLQCAPPEPDLFVYLLCQWASLDVRSLFHAFAFTEFLLHRIQLLLHFLHLIPLIIFIADKGLCSWLSWETLFFFLFKWSWEWKKSPIRLKREGKENGRRATAGTGSEPAANGGHESNQQSVPTAHTRAQSIHTHVAQCPDMLLCVFQELSGGWRWRHKTFRPSLSLCLHSV